MGQRFTFLDRDGCDDFFELERRSRYPARDLARHRAYQRELMSSAWGRRAWRIAALASSGGELGAALSLHDLSFRLGPRRLALAGISSLAVHPRYAGLDLDRELLLDVHAWLREQGYDGVVAFSTIGRTWFARLGYQVLPLAALEADLGDWRSSGPPVETASTVRPYAPPDFDAVRNLFNTTASLQHLAVLRDEEYWEFLLHRWDLASRMFREERQAFLVGERDGRVVSYLRAGVARGGGRLVVLEYGFEPGAVSDLTLLVRAVLESLGAERPAHLRSVVPTRFRTWCPARSTAWSAERRNVLLMLPLTHFSVPSESVQDERMIWSSDRF